MIVTCKKQIPIHWILFIILPWASFSYTWSTGGTAFLFSLKKFLENPAALTFIMSLPICISIIAGPFFNFLSDRIWTRYGRRKPLVIISLTGILCCLSLMPLMPNFWCLLAVYLTYCFFGDLNMMELLKQEVVPPHERGRATGAMLWCSNLAGIFFNFVALGRFEDVRFFAGLPITGEEIIYCSAGLLLSVMLLLIILGVKELDQHSPVRGQRFSIRNFVGGLADRELWPVYILVFGSAALNAGLGPLGNLLYTEQWGYSKQDMGINIAVGGALNVVLIGVLACFADRLNRMKAYRTLICISVGLNLSYFGYVTFILPDQRPSLVEIIAFGETGCIVAILTNMVYYPLVYDYIRRNKMGTYAAGATIVTRATGLITLNGVGLFIWAYTSLFQPPAGEMTRVVLQGGDTNRRSEIQASLQTVSWTDPSTQQPAPFSQIAVNAWQSDGTVSETGRAWEIRFRSASSAKLAEEKEKLEREVSRLRSEENILQNRTQSQEHDGKSTLAQKLKSEAECLHTQIGSTEHRIATISDTLDKRAADFEKQIKTALSARMLKMGDQLLDARRIPVLVVSFHTDKQPSSKALEKTLAQLRQLQPSVIDLRPVRTASGYAIETSLLKPLHSDCNALIELVRTQLERSHLLPATSPNTGSIEERAGLALNVMIVENSMTTYVSPITRVVNSLLSLINAEPSPDRKLVALARSLRQPDKINHVRITEGPQPKTISVLAVLPTTQTNSPNSDHDIAPRMRELLGTQPAGLTPQAIDFYKHLEEKSADQRITLARPILASSYSPMRYNYLCGYIWMFIMGSIGVAITMAFSHFENKGFIHKRGVEEAQES